MKKIFKLFFILVILVMGALQSFAAESKLNTLSGISIEPLNKNQYTLNLYFDKNFTGNAFLNKDTKTSYSIYIPDTIANQNKVKLLYNDKNDKKNIKINIESKPYTFEDQDSKYLKLSINMNNDYAIKFVKKKTGDSGMNSSNDINILGLLLAIFVALVAFFANKILNIVKENSKRTSYTHVPDELKNTKRYDYDYEFERQLGIRRSFNSEPVTKPNTTRTRESNNKSFECFDLGAENKGKRSTFDFKNQKESESLRKKVSQTNPITKNKFDESKELDLPLAENVLRQHNSKKASEEIDEPEQRAELLSVLNLGPNKGFYLTTVEDTIALFGFINDNVYLFKKFKDLSQINLQARYYDKNGNNDVYIVRIDSYKAMIEISDTGMQELAVL